MPRVLSMGAGRDRRASLEVGVGATPGVSVPPGERTPVGVGGSHALLRYVVRRVASGFATLMLVSGLIFFGTNSLPGNAVQVLLGPQAVVSPGAVRLAMRAAGLDRPVTTRYWDWLWGLVHGNLGRSLVTHEPVAQLLSGRLVNTIVLGLCALGLLIPLGLVLGTLSALRKDRALDHVIGTSTLTFLSVPEFVWGSLLAVVLGVWLSVFPSVSLVDPSVPTIEQPSLLVLPVLSILVVAMGNVTRYIRASTIDVLQSDFVQMAVLRGVPTRTLLVRHVLPNSLGPTIQVLAYAIGSLIGGVVVVETVFSYPGMGTLFVQSVGSRDITTVATIAMLISAAFILANLLADLAAMALNPRLRRGLS